MKGCWSCMINIDHWPGGPCSPGNPSCPGNFCGPCCCSDALFTLIPVLWLKFPFCPVYCCLVCIWKLVKPKEMVKNWRKNEQFPLSCSLQVWPPPLQPHKSYTWRQNKDRMIKRRLKSQIWMNFRKTSKRLFFHPPARPPALISENYVALFFGRC